MRTRRLSRRTFLRGAGTLLALPLLEQMLPSFASAQGAASPRRLAVFYAPCGVNYSRWAPTGQGTGYVLSPTLAPLAPVKEDVLVLTGLSHEPGRPDGPGHHAAATGAFLTCTKVLKTAGADIHNGISMDQVAANHLRGATRFASLELGCEGGSGVGDCDVGYSCSYTTNISWSGPTTPVPKETNPRAVFDRLFAGLDPGQSELERAKQRAYQKSILDVVLEDASTLRSQLGTYDQRKLDDYLASVRELERQVEQAEASGACAPGAPPAEDATDVRVKTKAMLDLMVLAFRCDLTRVITFMLANARTNRVYSFLGLTGAHHAYSHHDDIPANLEALATIDVWVMEQFSYLVQQLKAVQEPDGTLLDSALVYSGNEVQDPDHHGHRDLPVVLAGRGGGAVSPGRHVLYTQDEPVANLYISMLQTVGVSLTGFGDDGTGPLHSLTV
ncbi:MAG: DUF1552 domain-containing protein [Myxococcaceae bacterium]|nr:DUF1552 domain-containing protein [Myxococcaceae bacterium]